MMTDRPNARSPFQTHDVLNQSPPFEDINLYLSDIALREAVEREGTNRAHADLTAFGACVGSAESLALGRRANRHPPQLRTHDEKGRRLDKVEFHPAYHVVMQISMEQGLNCAPYEHLLEPLETPGSGAHVDRCAGSFLAVQMEPGHCCPVTMTHAAIPVIARESEIAATWLPKLLRRDYDPRFRPIAEKRAATIGMGMTEKQGGTDVRTNTSQAEPESERGSGRRYRITGHKWFLSAPMSDAFLVLAQADGGLSCFLMPRFRADGSVNALLIQRLKDKLGNRSNASCEVEFHGAEAVLIGEEGRGVPVIIEMVALTRLDCAVSSAALMRQAVAHAIHHAQHRKVFGRKLVDQPMMAEVLADMAIESEAATALAFRLAGSLDRAETDDVEAAFHRIMTPVIKYANCKAAPALSYEAMECLGGNGYVEDGPLARVYREAPVNAIWEGSGNVMGLDLLRAIARDPNAFQAVLASFDDVAAEDRACAALLNRIKDLLRRPDELECRARALVEGLARLAAASILRAHAPTAVADAYCATRLTGAPARTFGAHGLAIDTKAIVARAAPQTA